MRICKYVTTHYKHDYTFKVKGEEYYIHSVVRLTEKGREYLGSRTNEVILIEQFTHWDDRLCWKYQFRTNKISDCLVDYSTDKTPDELIEEVVIPATEDYMSREKWGAYSPVWTKGKKCVPKDWEIPKLISGWLVFILVFVGASLFQGGLVWVIRIVVCVIFAFYRHSYIEANTTYEHEEDDKITMKKLDVLYGTKFSKEDNTNE